MDFSTLASLAYGNVVFYVFTDGWPPIIPKHQLQRVILAWMSTDGTVVIGPDNFLYKFRIVGDENASFDFDKTLIVKNVPGFRQDRFK